MNNTMNRDALVEKYMYLAEKSALSRAKSTPPCVSYDDLKSAAYVGLLDAATKFDYDKSNADDADRAFVNYASLRIRGQIADYLRDCYWIGTRKNPMNVLFFDQMSMSKTKVNETGQCEIDYIINAKKQRRDSFHDTKRKEFLDEVLKTLPTEVKEVFQMYYIDGYTMKEIGDKVDFSESRISQLISQYKEILKKHLKGQKDELFSEFNS